MHGGQSGNTTPAWSTWGQESKEADASAGNVQGHDADAPIAAPSRIPDAHLRLVPEYSPDMNDHVMIHDPTMFTVWAHVDPEHLLRAAEHLATGRPMTVPQCYQLARQAAREVRRVDLWINVWYSDALDLVNDLPLGFVAGTAVIAHEGIDPAVSDFCRTHGCFHHGPCGVCDGAHLPL